MNPNVGSIEYDARINTKRLKDDAKNSEKIISSSADNAASSTESLGSRVTGAMGTMVKRAAQAMTIASVAASAFALKSAADFEQTRIGIQNMLGSADKAKALLKDISDFAAQTPFEFPELAGAARQLLAFGFNAEEAFNTMKNLGDVSAAVGAPINDLSYLMGTLRTQGRAFTIDIRQFAQRGIPIYEYLAKVLKTNEKAITEMITAGKIGFPEVQKAFQLMTAEGGKFHGSMAAQSKSLSGLMSTLQDNLGFIGRELIGINREGDVIAGSVFDKLRNSISAFIPALERSLPTIIEYGNKAFDAISMFASAVINVGKEIASYLAPKLGALVNSIRSIIDPARDLTKNYILPLAAALGQTLVWAIGLGIDTLNLLVRAIRPLMNWMNDHRTTTLALATAFGTLWAVMQVRTAFLAVQSAIVTLRMGFILQTVATVGLRGAITALFTAMGPLGWAMAALSVAAGLVVAVWNRGETAANKLKDAKDRLIASTNALRDAEDRLKGSELGVEGAMLRLERAQITATDATDRFGAKSLEAREATLELKRAQEDLRLAHDEAKDATNNHRIAEEEYARSGGLIDSANRKATALQQVVNTLRQSPNIPYAPAAPKSPSYYNPLGIGNNAEGTNNWRGGATWVGEKGPEIVDLPRGSRVIPNDAIGEMSGGGSNVFEYHIGTITISNEADGERWLKKLTQNQEIIGKGLTPQQSY